MRLFAVLVAICALTQTAIGANPGMQIDRGPRRQARLLRQGAPPPARHRKPPLRAAPDSKADAAKYVDTIGAEDALMNARLKNICRGC